METTQVSMVRGPTSWRTRRTTRKRSRASRVSSERSRAGRREQAPALQLAPEQRHSIIFGEIAKAPAAGQRLGRCEEVIDRGQEAVAVLAHVEGGEVEAEDPHAVDQRLHQEVGAGAGAVAAQAGVDLLQVLQERLGRGVGGVGGAVGDPVDRLGRRAFRIDAGGETVGAQGSRAGGPP